MNFQAYRDLISMVMEKGLDNERGFENADILFIAYLLGIAYKDGNVTRAEYDNLHRCFEIVKDIYDNQDVEELVFKM